ncbi:MAG: hypothetical protein A3G33_03875 [Omnitrophica bacterium RIFCSPLOWO2_12_FULL_44_17]|uniref:PurE domain-containing protein n=1 Tax=Candidatus Danuiimicrobium aquiferis TaxID=1801832 RepID=A0A1G1KSP0_9BACT|nr:MAG: hypothetical protein A3B72_02135 [Omnitrophica bacterium RIFCSPHIGHO2_02_FULL_45_28]OGW91441.1 MAG: hypothetical protein A3E74_08400 [Omnitrophica bacterium RIFCSPHIGHO2_12_FULL_44_12]OGW95917.1 MAG: hypothetical protein A3G33_03875 [Omnitrophica bacterium RIFCSPLOWO2_12_FULL_44_17]OGX01916.1 MAG: hypothetical protein A3J12_05290 [Omnitrophica bacterium RIFCSPLOWO2_02_FULL_44_11]
MEYSRRAIEAIIKRVSQRKLSPESAFKKLKDLSYESLGFAQLDHHRVIRKTLPEAIYTPGKTTEQIEKILAKFFKHGNTVLLTRLSEKIFRLLNKKFPALQYSKSAQLAFLNARKPGVRSGFVAVVTAGTSDIPVAEEAGVTLEALGEKVARFYDCGIAGLQRLLDHVRKIESADVVICVAGMEGALPSVLAGLISKPIIAVPTSVGYGANFKGVTPLLSMLNSCSQGVAVVNIDSGFSAGCFAKLIMNQINQGDTRPKKH